MLCTRCMHEISRHATSSQPRCVLNLPANAPVLSSQLIKSLATRAMSEAQYNSSGTTPPATPMSYHYGLALQYYTHFTSPIRRWAHSEGRWRGNKVLATVCGIGTIARGYSVHLYLPTGAWMYANLVRSTAHA